MASQHDNSLKLSHTASYMASFSDSASLRADQPYVGQQENQERVEHMSGASPPTPTPMLQTILAQQTDMKSAILKQKKTLTMLMMRLLFVMHVEVSMLNA